MKVELEIKVKPRPKERPRFYGHAYTPKRTREYEDLIRGTYAIKTDKVFDTPIKIEIRACFKIPNGISSVKKYELVGKPCTSHRKGDADNIAKAVLDGLNGIAYKDDTIVTDLHISKRWSTEDKLKITISDMEDE